jgi:hypothetical protein
MAGEPREDSTDSGADGSPTPAEAQNADVQKLGGSVDDVEESDIQRATADAGRMATEREAKSDTAERHSPVPVAEISGGDVALQSKNITIDVDSVMDTYMAPAHAAWASVSALETKAMLKADLFTERPGSA